MFTCSFSVNVPLPSGWAAEVENAQRLIDKYFGAIAIDSDVQSELWYDGDYIVIDCSEDPRYEDERYDGYEFDPDSGIWYYAVFFDVKGDRPEYQVALVVQRMRQQGYDAEYHVTHVDGVYASLNMNGNRKSWGIELSEVDDCLKADKAKRLGQELMVLSSVLKFKKQKKYSVSFSAFYDSRSDVSEMSDEEMFKDRHHIEVKKTWIEDWCDDNYSCGGFKVDVDVHPALLQEIISDHYHVDLTINTGIEGEYPL